MSNSVTVFSNGIADFVKKYPVKKSDKLQISIPVKKDNVADVLASLTVFGDVKLDSPASFSPANDLDKGELVINTKNVIVDLATKLSGSKISITPWSGEKPSRGILMGVHDQKYVSENLESHDYSIIVLGEDSKVSRFALEDVQNIQFLDETIQNEVNKSLQKNLQLVKPNSKFVDLVLVAEKDTEATLQYSLPVAAWKISYRILKNDDNFLLQGLAVVDNNTEEDWKDVIVSVVTGEPITFSTDLADSKIPNRGHVNIVKENAAGAVEVERGTPKMLRAMSMTSTAGHSISMNESVGLCSMESTLGGRGAYAAAGPSMRPETIIKEVGDYSVFSSKNPVTIASNKSAVIPVFDTKLKDTKSVLHYNPQNHPSRAYSSILIKNESEHSLGRGVCTIYFDNLYSGSCVVPDLKKGEEHLVAYALETGIKVDVKHKDRTSNLQSVKISNGVYISTTTDVIETNYIFENSKAENFDVYLDHPVQTNSNVRITATVNGKETDYDKELSLGYRFKFSVAEPTVVVAVTENRLISQNFELADGNTDWFFQYISTGVIKNMDELKPVLALKSKLDKIVEEIERNNNKIEKANTKSERIRKNIEVSTDSKKKEFQNDLGVCEQSINELEDANAKLEDEETIVNASITEALNNLNLEWSSR